MSRAVPYERLEKIGRGSFGEVFKGVDRESGLIVAIKSINLENDPEAIDEIRKEISVLANCESPNIIRYLGSYLVNTLLWIVMDYCALGSFREVIETVGPLPEAAVFFIAKQLLIALSYLHANHIIHRDLKAANVLITESGQVKLGDFGVAGRVLNCLRRNSFVGSPYWMAPEVIKRSQYDSKADIWSLGIVLYELLMGNPPLAHVEPARAIFIIPKNAPPRLDSSFSSQMRDLVAACLHDDPGKRPTADELFRHRSLRGIKAQSCPALQKFLEEYRSRKAKTCSKKPTSEEEDGALDGSTLKSNWTFGTFKSQEYFQDDPTTLGKEPNSDCAFADAPLRPQSVTQAFQAFEAYPEIDTPTKSGKSALLRSRSLSSLNLDSLTTNIPGVSQPSENLASDSSTLLSLEHSALSKPPSLLFLNLRSVDEKYPENPLISRRRAREAYRRGLLKMEAELDPIPLQLNDEEVESLDAAYEKIVGLRDALMEIPLVRPTYASAGDLRDSINEQLQTALRYVTILAKAARILGRNE